jgi:hypothetical protein
MGKPRLEEFLKRAIAICFPDHGSITREKMDRLTVLCRLARKMPGGYMYFAVGFFEASMSRLTESETRELESLFRSVGFDSQTRFRLQQKGATADLEALHGALLWNIVVRDGGRPDDGQFSLHGPRAFPSEAQGSTQEQPLA